MTRQQTIGVSAVIALLVAGSAAVAWRRYAGPALPKSGQKSSSAPVLVPFQQEREEGGIVAGFPEVLSYPRANIIFSSEKRRGEQQGYTAQFITGDDLYAVARYYKELFRKQGWSFTESGPPSSSREYSLGVSIHYQGKSYRSGVSLEVVPEGTEIIIHIGAQ